VDFERWKEVFRDQSKVTFKLYPKLNHFFISGEGESMPDEYLQPGHVAETVVAWDQDFVQGHFQDSREGQMPAGMSVLPAGLVPRRGR